MKNQNHSKDVDLKFNLYNNITAKFLKNLDNHTTGERKKLIVINKKANFRTALQIRISGKGIDPVLTFWKDTTPQIKMEYASVLRNCLQITCDMVWFPSYQVHHVVFPLKVRKKKILPVPGVLEKFPVRHAQDVPFTNRIKVNTNYAHVKVNNNTKRIRKKEEHCETCQLKNLRKCLFSWVKMRRKMPWEEIVVYQSLPAVPFILYFPKPKDQQQGLQK